MKKWIINFVADRAYILMQEQETIVKKYVHIPKFKPESWMSCHAFFHDDSVLYWSLENRIRFWLHIFAWLKGGKFTGLWIKLK